MCSFSIEFDSIEICFPARAISEGGLQSIPKFIFPGGALVGDSAGLRLSFDDLLRVSYILIAL